MCKERIMSLFWSQRYLENLGVCDVKQNGEVLLIHILTYILQFLLNLSRSSSKLLPTYIERTHFRISLLRVFSLGLVRNQNEICAGLLFHTKPNRILRNTWEVLKCQVLITWSFWLTETRPEVHLKHEKISNFNIYLQLNSCFSYLIKS